MISSMEEKTVAENRKAKLNYEIIRTIEAGISLSGSEVKSLRQGRVNLKDSFARIENGEVYLYHMHISQYKYSSEGNYNPERPRKLLLHRNQIARLIGEVKEKGFTIIPLKVYFKGKWAKVELALAKGRKAYDKRELIKKREQERLIKRMLKKRI